LGRGPCAALDTPLTVGQVASLLAYQQQRRAYIHLGSVLSTTLIE